MGEFFFDYGLFALKALTIVLAIVIVVVVSVAAGARVRKSTDGHIEVTKLNDEFDQMRETLNAAVIDFDAYKAEVKRKKKEQKAERKARKKALKEKSKDDASEAQDAPDGRLFVLDFDGDIKASAVGSLRREITTVLSSAGASDEVLVRLESGGGMVHAYGLAASQLQRIKNKGVTLTVSVDKVAAAVDI